MRIGFTLCNLKPNSASTFKGESLEIDLAVDVQARESREGDEGSHQGLG